MNYWTVRIGLSKRNNLRLYCKHSCPCHNCTILASPLPVLFAPILQTNLSPLRPFFNHFAQFCTAARTQASVGDQKRSTARWLWRLHRPRVESLQMLILTQLDHEIISSSRNRRKNRSDSSWHTLFKFNSKFALPWWCDLHMRRLGGNNGIRCCVRRRRLERAEQGITLLPQLTPSSPSPSTYFPIFKCPDQQR